MIRPTKLRCFAAISPGCHHVWACIYGKGCQGIYADRPHDGCCTLGAHFADADDEKRVGKAVRQLKASQWQYKKDARVGGWVENEHPDHLAEGELPGRKTRVIDGACIFLNRPGFPAGQGCALHLLALSQDRDFLETKPCLLATTDSPPVPCGHPH